MTHHKAVTYSVPRFSRSFIFRYTVKPKLLTSKLETLARAAHVLIFFLAKVTKAYVRGASAREGSREKGFVRVNSNENRVLVGGYSITRVKRPLRVQHYPTAP